MTNPSHALRLKLATPPHREEDRWTRANASCSTPAHRALRFACHDDLVYILRRQRQCTL